MPESRSFKNAAVIHSLNDPISWCVYKNPGAEDREYFPEDEYDVEITITKKFKPGYFRMLKNNLGQPQLTGPISWWGTDPGDRFERVKVTPDR
jgi:hypothetical protein